MQKQIKIAQLIGFILIVALIAMGTASAADSLSDNSVTCVNHAPVKHNALKTTNVSKKTKNLSINKTKSSNIQAIQIWKDGVPVSRGGQPAEHNWGTIQNAVNIALSGDTIMLENGSTFTGEGNSQITLNKSLNFNVLNEGRADIDGQDSRWGFVVNRGVKASFNNITFKNMLRLCEGSAVSNNGGSLSLNHCLFANNTAQNSVGVIYNTGSLYVNQCLIYENQAKAGMYTAGYSKVVITNSTFCNVNDGESAITVQSGNPEITGNTIYGNFKRGITIISGGPVISNNKIGQNYLNGDGILINGGNPTITYNNIRNNALDGIHVNGTTSPTSQDPMGIHYNTIVGNGYFGLHVLDHVYVDATHNWWGTNSPVYLRQILFTTQPKDIFEQCDSSSKRHVSYNPYLYLRIKRDSAIYNGNTSTIKVYLTRDNRKNNNMNLSPGTVPDGTVVTFNMTNGTYGSFTSPVTLTTVGGVATITFTANDPNAPHTQNISATVDHQQVTAGIKIKPQAHVIMSNKSNTPAHVGQIGKFTVTLTNMGPNPAKYIEVQEHITLPHFDYIQSKGNYDLGHHTWTIYRLESGESASLIIFRTMQQKDMENYVQNTVTESQSTHNPKPVKSQTAILTTYTSAEVTMTKTCNSQVVAVGQTGKFTVTVINNGPNKAKNVQVTDRFINGFTYTPSTGKYSPSTGIWTIGTLANGATATLTISRTMQPSDLGIIYVNIASETQSTYNPKPVTPKVASISVNRVAHVIMTKTCNGPVYVGERGTFIIKLTNNGPNDATNVQVRDPYISGFLYQPSTGSYNFVTGIWTISRLVNGAAATLTITKVMSPTDVGRIHNTASETQTTYNPKPITPQSTTLTVNPVAQVSMTKTSNGPLYVGDRGIFTITLTNNGPNDATNVLVNDPYISGFTYSSSIGTYDPETGIWNISKLANGATATLTISKVLSANDVGLIINHASETQDTYNPKPVTQKVASITVRPVAHVVLSNISNGPVYAGKRGTFTVTLTNTGPNDAIRVIVIDRFINGFTYTPSIGTYNPSNGIWDIGVLESGATATLTISRIMHQSDVGTRIYNTAYENQETYDPLPVTPQIAVLDINPVAHVIMTKTSTGQVYVGHRGTFTITLMNKGPDNATNVQVRDPFMRGFTYKPSVGTYDPETGIWTISRLLNGQTATLIVTKIMSATDVGPIHNTASETQETYNPNPITSKTATLTVNAAAHVIMTKTSTGPVNIGQKGTFIIKLTNKGPNDATNVQLKIHT